VYAILLQIGPAEVTNEGIAFKSHKIINSGANSQSIVLLVRWSSHRPLSPGENSLGENPFTTYIHRLVFV